MATRRDLVISVMEWDDDFAVSARDFIEDLTEAVDGVPEEFRDELILEFDRNGSDYDFSRGELSLHYTRPETDAELAERQRYEDESRRRDEDRERADFARLKAKFEKQQ